MIENKYLEEVNPPRKSANGCENASDDNQAAPFCPAAK